MVKIDTGGKSRTPLKALNVLWSDQYDEYLVISMRVGNMQGVRIACSGRFIDRSTPSICERKRFVSLN